MSSTTAQAEKRCYYEVLNLPQTCTQDEIRSSYKKLALQRHPDKLIQSGISAIDATASFQELRHAYEVLSDPKERSYYDSHRSQILYSSPFDSNNNMPDRSFPDLFSYFTTACYTDYVDSEKGFYKVYGEVFNRVYLNEVNYVRKLGLGLGLVKEAPLIGELGSDYGQVTAFYGYWLGFATVMDFGWVNKWDANAGENRRARRAMEEENKKVRKKAKREFNDMVRGLAEFVKKRDKRVIDMGIKKEKERERKREEEARKRKEIEREKVERARNYVEPDWAKVDHEDVIVEDEDDDEENEKRELYCAACGKKFKSDKQWKNHEQSRKHKDKVAELKRFFKEDDVEFQEFDGVGNDNGNGNDEDKDDGFVSAEDEDDVGIEVGFDVKDNGDELNEKFKDEDDVGNGGAKDGVEAGFDVKDDGGELNEEFKECVVIDEGNDDGDERRRGKKVTFEEQSIENNRVESEGEMESVEVDNKKVKKKSRRAKKDKGKANDGSNELGENSKDLGGVSDGDDDEYGNRNSHGRRKGGKKAADRQSKRDVESKPKNSSKGRKQKEKDPNPVCEKCGEEFDSRNQLYKHLSETGHASLKSR